MVVGVAAPHQAEVIAELADTDGTLHGPEVRIGQRDIYAALHDAVVHLTPVGVDHVGSGGHSALPLELGHDLAAGEAVLGTAGVLAVGQALLELGCDLQRFLQAPAAVGVQIDAGIGERSLDGLHSLQLFLRGQDAALELEVLKAVLLVGGLCQRNDGLRGQGLLVAQTIPVAVGIRLLLILEVGLLAVAHIEQVAQETDTLALDAVAHQGSGGNFQELAHQVQQRGLNGGDHMDAGAQVEGLQAADIVLDVGAQPCTDLVQGLLVVGDPGAQHQMLHILQRLGDLLTAGHLAHAFHTIGIGQDDDVPGEIRCMCAREVQLHAVVTCDRIDLHFFNGRDSHILSPFLLVCALARIISRSLRPRPCVCAVGPDLFFTGTMIPDWHFFDNRGTTQTTGGKSGILHFFSKNEISVSFLFRSVQSCRK